MAQMLIRAPDDLKEILQGEARRIGIPLNALLIQILRNWTDNNIRDDRQITGASAHRDGA